MQTNDFITAWAALYIPLVVRTTLAGGHSWHFLTLPDSDPDLMRKAHLKAVLHGFDV